GDAIMHRRRVRISQRVLAHRAVGQVQVDMSTRLCRWQWHTVGGFQLDAFDIIGGQPLPPYDDGTRREVNIGSRLRRHFEVALRRIGYGLRLLARRYGGSCDSHRCSVSQFGWIQVGASDAGSGSRPRIMSLAFSAIMMVGAFVLPLTTAGMIDASTTRRPRRPWTRSSGSTTFMPLSAGPMRHVPAAW